jgi:hypothetical protein
MKHLRNWALRGYLIWSISVDCIAIGAIIWILLPMASGLLDEPLRKPTNSGLLDEPLRKPTDMVQPLRKPTQGFLEQMQQPTVLQILDPSTMKEPVGNGAIWAVFSRDGDYISGPFYTEEEAQTAEMVLYGLLGDSPVSEYQEMGKDLNYQETHFEARQAPRIIEQGVEERPLVDQIKEAFWEILGGVKEGLLGLSPISDAGATMLPEDQDGNTNYRLPKADMSSILPEDQAFFNNWHDYYYAGKQKDSGWVGRASKRIAKWKRTLRSSSASDPTIARNAIDIAVDALGTDYGKDGKARKKRYGEDRLRADLERIGAIESDYATIEAYGPDNTDSGYWQVQPLTAFNSLRDAPDHFGKDFDEKFAPHGWSYNELLQMTKDELQALMRERDDEGNPVPINQALAASFAAVKILQTFDY